jgi:hypothetical protein
MNIESIELASIYREIRSCYPKGCSPPPLPERDEEPYVKFRKSYKQVIKKVPQTNGVYLWYAVRPNNQVEYIYVGESHSNKSGLRGRLDDEFRRTYHGFWATVFASDKYLEEAITVFGDRTRYNPKKSYETDIRNDYERHGATHVVFCHDVTAQLNVVAVQNDLIQLFDNPRGNIKDVRTKPLPESQLSAEAKVIYKSFCQAVQSSQPCSI